MWILNYYMYFKCNSSSLKLVKLGIYFKTLMSQVFAAA